MTLTLREPRRSLISLAWGNGSRTVRRLLPAFRYLKAEAGIPKNRRAPSIREAFRGGREPKAEVRCGGLNRRQTDRELKYHGGRAMRIASVHREGALRPGLDPLRRGRSRRFQGDGRAVARRV